MYLKISKLFSLFLIISLLSGAELFAQKIDNQQSCGTPATSFEELQKKFYFGDNDTLYRLLARLPQLRQEVHGGTTPITDRVWRDDDPNIIWSVPVTFWAYTATAGGYPTAHQDAQEVIDELNRNFNKNRLPIRFYQYCDVNVIVNAHFANTGNDSDVSDMMSNHAINGSLNIHFVSPSMSFAGLHKTVWVPFEYSYAVFLTRDAVHDGSTSTHEVGHFFELDHTHNNYDADWMPQCRREPVDRNRTWPFFSLCLDKIFSSNRMCNSTGDALCDTPADPELNSDTMVDDNCNYKNLTRRDYWGDSYFNPPAGSSQPDTRNFMSYSYYRQCLSRFSDGQRAVMISSIHSGRYSRYSAAWGSPVVRFDTYEPDHRPQTARRIEIEEKQLHTFHKTSLGATFGFNQFIDCDIDHVYFDVPVAGRYTILTSPETGKTHANTIIRLYAYNPTTNEVGALLAENDDFNGTVFSQVEIDLPAGRYVVEINNASRNSTANFGYYNIQVLPCVSNQNYSLNLSPSNVGSLCLAQNYILSINPNDADILGYIWEVTPTNALANVVQSANALNFTINPAFSFQEVTIGVMVVKACGASAVLQRTFPIGNPAVLYDIPRQTEFCYNDTYMPYASIALTPRNGVAYNVSTTHTQATLTQKSPTDWEVRSRVATQIPITVTASNSCGTVTDNFTIEAIDCRSNDPCGQAVIYPNPTSQYATFQFMGAWTTAPILQVYNQIGQLVEISYEVQPTSNTESQIILNTSKLPKGIYYVSVAGELGTAKQAPLPCRMAKTLIIEEPNHAR